MMNKYIHYKQEYIFFAGDMLAFLVDTTKCSSYNFKKGITLNLKFTHAMERTVNEDMNVIQKFYLNICTLILELWLPHILVRGGGVPVPKYASLTQ
jgi:hypothetical protein